MGVGLIHCTVPRSFSGCETGWIGLIQHSLWLGR